MKTFSITDIGRKRKLNQDYVYTSETPVGALPNLFVVADGMGGHKAGDYASRCTIETMVEYAENADDTGIVAVLEQAILKANEVVIEKAESDEALNGMGTTVVAACIDGDEMCVANVGDSRLYVVSNREITQITRDHSLVEEMVRMGGLKREQARTHPDKNIITRAIGAQQNLEIDFFKVKLDPDDLVLMCSDGLTNMLEDEEIRMILQGQRDLVEKAECLVNAANNNGGKDNITVVLISPAVNGDNR
ncbi:MAG: Stp1/IreP family PP2C-type Ser/Thr phosphatase [Lachnospiraceae bacterium]|nr:Stp1/IreP family PP2C-type Ser/Thr phosphatase [Candidatus Colinaster scatohippi]